MIITENKKTLELLALLQEFPGFDEWFDNLSILDSVELQCGLDGLMEDTEVKL